MNAKTLAVALAATLTVAGGAAAVTGTGPAATETTGKADVISTYDDGAVTVTVGQGGDAVEGATVEIGGETDTTDSVGTATAENVAVEDELTVEVDADGFEAELTYEFADGTLTLVEETYEYERGDVSGAPEHDDESEDDGNGESEEKRGPPEDVPADENAYEKDENGENDDEGDDVNESADGDDEKGTDSGADDDDGE